MPNSAVQLFLSYRRADLPDLAGRIYDTLSQTFQDEGVVLDVHSIQPGDAFPIALAERIATSTSVLALIGPRWTSGGSLGPDPGGARSLLLNPDDYVRRELEFAISRSVPIIPILLADSEMPALQELPPILSGLVTLNAIRVRRDPDFSKDVERVIEAAWKHRRVDGRFLGTLSVPRIPADLISPLSVLVKSAVFSRQITIAVVAGQDFKAIYPSNVAAIQAMDHTISIWAAFFGQEEPPDIPERDPNEVTFKNQIDRSTVMEELNDLFLTVDLQARIGAALDYYDISAESFNRWQESLSCKLDTEALKHVAEVAGSYLARILNSFDEVETLVSQDFKDRMHQAWHAADIAPVADRIGYYLHLMRGVQTELRACIEERRERLLNHFSPHRGSRDSL